MVRPSLRRTILVIISVFAGYVHVDKAGQVYMQEQGKPAANSNLAFVSPYHGGSSGTDAARAFALDHYTCEASGGSEFLAYAWFRSIFDHGSYTQQSVNNTAIWARLHVDLDMSRHYDRIGVIRPGRSSFHYRVADLNASCASTYQLSLQKHISKYAKQDHGILKSNYKLALLRCNGRKHNQNSLGKRKQEGLSFQQ